MLKFRKKLKKPFILRKFVSDNGPRYIYLENEINSSSRKLTNWQFTNILMLKIDMLLLNPIINAHYYQGISKLHVSTIFYDSNATATLIKY